MACPGALQVRQAQQRRDGRALTAWFPEPRERRALPKPALPAELGALPVESVSERVSLWAPRVSQRQALPQEPAPEPWARL